VQPTRVVSQRVVRRLLYVDRCFVVGTGPSLEGFDFSLLDGEETIAINHAVRFFEPTYVYWSDPKLPDELTEAILNSDAFRYSVDRKTTIPNTVVLARNGGPSNSFDDGLFYNQNSGTAAFNLAVLLGYDPIYLLGMDMGSDNVRTHFYPNDYWVPNCIYEYQAKFYDYFYHERYGMNMPEVYNCSPISKIKAFPFKDIREVLNGQVI